MEGILNCYLMIFSFRWVPDNKVVTMSQQSTSYWKLKNIYIVSSPIKSWILIFIEATLNVIVNYTNNYGWLNAKELEDILKSDIINFLSVNLIEVIIKLNYQPSQWFICDSILGHDAIKHIMSGRKFLRIMSYLHICGMNKKLSSKYPEYDPLFKIRYFQRNL